MKVPRTRYKLKSMLDKTSLVIAIKKCTKVRDLKTIHAHAIRAGLSQDIFLAGSLIESAAVTLPSYHVAYAHSIFSSTHHQNLFTWNTIIRGYSSSDSPITAMSLYQDMLLSGISPNTFTLGFVLKACCKFAEMGVGKMVHSQILKLGFDCQTAILNSLMKFYVNCGCAEYARNLFEEMRQRDAMSWSTMISGYAQNGLEVNALDIFRRMLLEGVNMDGFTLASVAGICAHLGALDLGKWVHSYIDKEGIKVDVVLGTSLVDMYSKCGSLDDALRVFQGMRERDVMAWSAMIGGYATHGQSEKALQLFEGMKRANVKPNCVTFTSVLFVCSHSGLIDEGCRHFDSMQLEYGIVPEIQHCGCMVDLFCRAGLVDRAHEFIRNMRIKPNAVLWRTLLGTCKTDGFTELGEHASRKILELEPDGGDNYVLVSNVYASLGKWSSVSKVRSLMKDKKVKKGHGWSSIEVNFVVHQFVMGDETHPETDEIYQMLDEMTRKVKKEGYLAATTDVLHDIDEEEKEQALGFHSERLAVAYGLLRLPEDSPIRIVKNLRVCRDCHSFIKLISTIYKREIIARDRVRFHHFRDGECTCNDYW
ncbi:hypothetical protein RJ640_013019 [Escallonia rubra]|uniref:DYW domain-containing protein n=1 Tax=Escallonia rubra TaxID=112253 RepID=A0AA88QTE7_9ASTE|nr:hypothetical protein RJ640_013019 [Escallonia rubra]